MSNFKKKQNYTEYNREHNHKSMLRLIDEFEHSERHGPLATMHFVAGIADYDYGKDANFGEVFFNLAKKYPELVTRKYDLGNTLLMSAVAGTNIEIVKYLIEQGIDINAQNERGTTALIYCCSGAPSRKNKMYEVIRFLLEKGADPSIRNNEGKSAYDYASQRGRGFSKQICELVRPCEVVQPCTCSDHFI